MVIMAAQHNHWQQRLQREVNGKHGKKEEKQHA